jgi:hypothetical protein
MRSYEFVIEQELDEAINLSQYEPAIRDAMVDAIPKAFVKFEKEFSNKQLYPEQEELYNNGYMRELNKILAPEFLQIIWPKMVTALRKISQQIEPSIQSVRFLKMRDSLGGYASSLDIAINVKYIHKLSQAIYDEFQEVVLNSSGEGQLLRDMWNFCRDPNIGKYVLRHGSAASIIDRIASVLVHELVHVVQHAKQSHRTDGKLEFRSYLDRSKNEFLKLARKKENEKTVPLTAGEKARYWDLYFADPSEISAHAHNIAIKIINEYELADTSNYPKESYIENARSALADVTRHVDDYLHKRYKTSYNKQKQMIYKRYIKLTYQEVRHRVDRAIASYDKPDSPVPN